MDRRFAKFTETSGKELMLDISIVVAIEEADYGAEIITEYEDYSVINSFEEVRKILAI
jgi:hypothetical protein